MCFLKSEHFKNDEENKSILDLLIELEIVRVGWHLGQHEVMLPNQAAVVQQLLNPQCEEITSRHSKLVFLAGPQEPAF